MAKFDPFLSLDCARVEGVGAHLATLSYCRNHLYFFTHHRERHGLCAHEGLELPALPEGPPGALDGHRLPLVPPVVRGGPRRQGAPERRDNLLRGQIRRQFCRFWAFGQLMVQGGQSGCSLLGVVDFITKVVLLYKWHILKHDQENNLMGQPVLTAF